MSAQDSIEGMPSLGGEAVEILSKHCKEIKIERFRLEEMIQKEREMAGKARRRGLLLELEELVRQSLVDLMGD